MALSKNVTLDSGAVASYWKVFSDKVSWHLGRADFVLAGFLDENARNANKQPLDYMSYSIEDISDVLDIDTATVSQLYTYLKTLPEWDDAEDA